MIGALHLYEQGLLGAGAPELRVRMRGGACRALPLSRWLAPATAADDALLQRARGPVIDLGCGPGRHLHALARRGVFGLGVDISPTAVALARRHGVVALEASVFDELPGAGTWRTALLLDGNIGIGGDPLRLLQRIRAQLCPEGEILLETDPPGVPSATLQVRIEAGAQRSQWFAWARVAADELAALASRADLSLLERWQEDGRWFAHLRVGRALSGGRLRAGYERGKDESDWGSHAPLADGDVDDAADLRRRGRDRGGGRV